MNLLIQDGERGPRNVDWGVLLRVRWGDDGHQVTAVTLIDLEMQKHVLLVLFENVHLLNIWQWWLHQMCFFSWAYLGIPKRKVVVAFFYFYQADWDRPHPETKHMRVSQLIFVCIGCWHFILKIKVFFIKEMGKKWDNSPHGEDLEEFYHQGRSGSIWVHLTNPGYHYGPRYTAQETQLVGVNVTLWRETTENIRLQHLYYYLKAPFRYLIRLL